MLLIDPISAAPPGRAVPICYKLQVFCLLRANGVELLRSSNTLKYRSQPSEGGEGSLGAQPFVCFLPEKSGFAWTTQSKFKNAGGWRSQECAGGKRRQAIEALRFNYFIQFSETLYNYEYDEYSRLSERIEAPPLTISRFLY